MAARNNKQQLPIAYQEIKRPFAYLTKNDGNTRSVWWVNGSVIVCFDDIPENYPRWIIGCLTFQEAIKRLKQMERDNWKLVESNIGNPSQNKI
jgi:hypothetical protein